MPLQVKDKKATKSIPRVPYHLSLRAKVKSHLTLIAPPTWPLHLPTSTTPFLPSTPCALFPTLSQPPFRVTESFTASSNSNLTLPCYCNTAGPLSSTTHSTMRTAHSHIPSRKPTQSAPSIFPGPRRLPQASLESSSPKTMTCWHRRAPGPSQNILLPCKPCASCRSSDSSTGTSASAPSPSNRSTFFPSGLLRFRSELNPPLLLNPLPLASRPLGIHGSSPSRCAAQ